MDRYADALYLDQVRLLKLRYDAPPLSEDDWPHFRNLLHLVSPILGSSRSSSAHSKNLMDGVGPPKLQSLTHSLSSDSSGSTFINDWALWASNIGREMAFQGEGNLPEAKTWEILKNYQEIPLKAMAILSLVAFATMYGKAELVGSSSSSLAAQIASLKQQPPVRDGDTAFPRWKESLIKLLDRVLDVAYRVLEMEEPPPPTLAGRDAKYLNRLLLPSAVHKIVNVIFVCWKLVEDIMIKRNREELHTSLVKFDSYKWKLENKIREFKLDANRKVPNEQTHQARGYEQARGLSENEGQSSSSCWWKLRQLMKDKQLIKAPSEVVRDATSWKITAPRLFNEQLLTVQLQPHGKDDLQGIQLLQQLLSTTLVRFLHQVYRKDLLGIID